MKKIIIFSIIIISALFANTSLQAGDAMKLLEADISKILQVVKDPALKGETNNQPRRDKIRAILAERFDFKRMSILALGKSWKKITKEEKTEFSALFRELLENTYIDKMEQYTNESINMIKEKELGKNKVMVETSIIISSGEIPIIYKMINKKDNWKVYDVNIEGVGLIKNYRTQFKDILYKDPFSELIKMLKEKLNKA